MYFTNKHAASVLYYILLYIIILYLLWYNIRIIHYLGIN